MTGLLLNNPAKPKRLEKKMIVSGVAAALGLTGTGFAWSAELEEVVVTARQRAESSQEIPMRFRSRALPR